MNRGQSVKETARKHIDHNRFKAQKAKEEFKSTNIQKDKLEGKIKTLEEVYQVLQDELLEMANSSELYEELLKKSIFKGDYKNVEEFQQRIMDAEEAAKIWEYMQEFYSESVELYQNINDDVERQCKILQYEEVQSKDPESNELITLNVPTEKHYTGTWNFAIDVSMNNEGTQVVKLDRTNDNGIGIASVEKTAFEIKAQIILPDGAQPYDYVVAICDADGKLLESQGEAAEIYSTYNRNTDTVYVYICDYVKFMDELKRNDRKIAEYALFGTEVHFN